MQFLEPMVSNYCTRPNRGTPLTHYVLAPYTHLGVIPYVVRVHTCGVQAWEGKGDYRRRKCRKTGVEAP